MTTVTRNPRLVSRSPKAEFTLAYAVNARNADNMEKRTLIPSGTDIIIMRRFGRLPSSGKSMVEFAPAEPSGDEVGKFYRAWSGDLVPVGSKKVKEMTQAKVKGGFMPNPSTKNPAKLKFLWNHMKTGHWQGIHGGMTKAYVRKGGSGKYYVEMPGAQGGMTYPQVEFDSLRKAQEWVEEHAKGGAALNPATTAPGKIKNIDGAVVLRNPYGFDKDVGPMEKNPDDAYHKQAQADADAVYREKVRVPKYNVPVSPLTADYTVAGRLLRQRLNVGKKTHLETGDELAKKAQRQELSYRTRINIGLKKMKSQGVDPGPVISGIVSGKFSEREKEVLRTMVTNMNENRSAAMAHYAAAGIRHETALARYRGFGTGRNPMSKLSPSEKRKLSVPQQHQLRIARDTLRMPDAIVGVMGGPNKAEAREIIKRLTRRTARENPLSTCPGCRKPISNQDAKPGVYTCDGCKAAVRVT